MSLLATAERLNTANQINGYYKSAISGMETVKQNFDALSRQSEAMKINPEYSPEDIQEIEALKESIITFAKSLIPDYANL